MYGPETSPSASLQFADGVYLVLLMGLLEDYFVPLHNFYLTPDSFDQKVRVWSPSSEWPGNVLVTRAPLVPAASQVPSFILRVPPTNAGQGSWSSGHSVRPLLIQAGLAGMDARPGLRPSAAALGVLLLGFLILKRSCGPRPSSLLHQLGR